MIKTALYYKQKNNKYHLKFLENIICPSNKNKQHWNVRLTNKTNKLTNKQKKAQKPFIPVKNSMWAIAIHLATFHFWLWPVFGSTVQFKHNINYKLGINVKGNKWTFQGVTIKLKNHRKATKNIVKASKLNCRTLSWGVYYILQFYIYIYNAKGIFKL